MPFFSRHKAFSIFYMDEGPSDAPATVLLIPGFSCDMHDWSWQVPFLLSLNLRVISIDPRGQGRSSAPQPTNPHRLPPGSWPGPEGSADPDVIDYYPQSTALDLIALLDHLGISKNLVVMAHSLGTAAAYFIAAERPGLAVALVALDPIHAFTTEMHEQGDAMFDSAETILSGVADHFNTHQYTPASPAWQKTWHIRRMRQLDDNVAFAILWGGTGDPKDRIGSRENAVALFGGRIKCPRLTFGSTDWYIETDLKYMPKADEKLDEIVMIGGKGHWFHQLESEEFNAHLERWLSKVGVLPVKTAE
ncbi:alpha beta hydrolase fold protein [Colletotrichum truncatum]|uniref:Alpha beta hydrolase fold protein n=1 Tax=Colletotrichum truncatum TaxID=5467 RepID=A0ACC3Z2Q7_COLTU